MRRMLALPSSLLLFSMLAIGHAAINEDFDGGGTTPFTLFSRGGSPPSIVDDGPTGSFARITNLNGSNFNNIAFDEDPTQSGPAPDGLTIGFDFRMTDDAANNAAGGCCNSAADGIGFGLFDTGTYGDSGAANPSGPNWENPSFADAFTIGFDVFQNIDVVSINWAGSLIKDADVADFLDLNNNLFNRAEVTLTPDGRNTLVDLIIREDVNGIDEEHVIFDGERITGMDLPSLFNYRVIAGGRTGGAFLDGDFDNIAVPDKAPEPFLLNGSGETYSQDFDEMGTSRGMPKGWSGEDFAGTGRRIDSLGLKDGPLNFPEDESIQGIANVGGNANNFTTSGGKVATWKADQNGDGTLNGDDAIAEGATDRALGIARVEDDETGNLLFEIEITNKPLRAFTLDWDLEVWGGDPEDDFRGTDGPGLKADLSIGGADYYSQTGTVPVDGPFDTFSDGGATDFDSTLIDGNTHSLRGLGTDGLVEVNGDDGAVGNTVNIKFDANWGGNDNSDGGWLVAVDNLQLRAVAPGDVDGNGSVDPLDIVELLKGGQFGKGVNGVTWQQGDFNGDDKFDPLDLVEVLTFLSGEFPTTYASELGNGGDGTPDVIVDAGTGEVTVDFAGHISSSIIIDSAAGIFNGDAPAWDTMGEFRTASANQISNTLFSGTESGVDSLGNLVKAEFMSSDEAFFLNDLTVQILVATPDGPVTVDGHVIVVPEPSTWMLLGLGSLAIVGVVRRRSV